MRKFGFYFVLILLTYSTSAYSSNWLMALRNDASKNGCTKGHIAKCAQANTNKTASIVCFYKGAPGTELTPSCRQWARSIIRTAYAWNTTFIKAYPVISREVYKEEMDSLRRN